MCAIITVNNQKGGVGKTLTSGLIAEYAALIKSLRVLLVDLDLQANTSDQWVGMELAPNKVGGQLPPIHPDYSPEYGVNERSTIADIFYGTPVLPYSTWITPDIAKGGCVDVLIAHPQKLEEVNIEFSKKGQLESSAHNRIRDFLLSPEVQDSYDLIILDTGPSRNPVFRGAIRAASHMIIPFKPEEKDIQGISAMLQIVRQENYSRTSDMEQLELIGLLPNMVRHTSLHKKNLNLFLEKHSSITYPQNSWLSNLTAFPERDMKDSRPKSIFELPESAAARQQAEHMTKYTLEKIGL